MFPVQLPFAVVRLGSDAFAQREHDLQHWMCAWGGLLVLCCTSIWTMFISVTLHKHGLSPCKDPGLCRLRTCEVGSISCNQQKDYQWSAAAVLARPMLASYSFRRL